MHLNGFPTLILFHMFIPIIVSIKNVQIILFCVYLSGILKLIHNMIYLNFSSDCALIWISYFMIRYRYCDTKMNKIDLDMNTWKHAVYVCMLLFSWLGNRWCFGVNLKQHCTLFPGMIPSVYYNPLHFPLLSECITNISLIQLILCHLYHILHQLSFEL